jgi:hypothetical protein
MVSRRSLVAAVGFVPLMRMVPRSTWEVAFAASADLRFFDEHQAAVVTEATARLIPGPSDDPAEKGHPGAREAGVTGYIDLFLSAFDEDPPRIFRTGPWSDRHGGPDKMNAWIPLTAAQEAAWRKRIHELQGVYRRGIADLDRRAGGDFAAAGPAAQDRILVAMGGDGFRRVLFEHAIEGTYAAPEYGGNRRLAGWVDIGYAGDIAPMGYQPAEVSATSPDPVPLGFRLPFPPDMSSPDAGPTPTLGPPGAP